MSFSFHGQNTLFCYAIGKKFRVLACLHHDFLFFSRTPTLSTSFHGPNTLFCNNISRDFCVPLCLVFHACLLISRILQNEKILTSEKGRQV